jgi:peptide/nickel transport system permease protein
MTSDLLTTEAPSSFAAPEVSTPATALRSRRFRVGVPLAVVLALAFLAFLALSTIVPQWIATSDPLAVTTHVLAGPSAAHPLGTDENGRDVFSRIVYGARESLMLGFGAIALSVLGGSILGILAGLGNRFVETVVMRFIDIGLAFPEMLLALVVIAISGAGTVNALIAIGVAGIPSFARLVRAQTLGIRKAAYVDAARALGLREPAIVLRHILPNALRPILVLATIGVGTATIAGAALSFIGLGTPPPAPSWGVMLSTARNFLGQSWWYGIFPGLAITLMVVSVTVVGHWLQRRLEGRSR